MLGHLTSPNFFELWIIAQYPKPVWKASTTIAFWTNVTKENAVHIFWLKVDYQRFCPFGCWQS